MDQITAVESLVDVLMCANELQLSNFNIQTQRAKLITSFHYTKAATHRSAIPIARLYPASTGPSFGTHMGNGASLLVNASSEKVLIDAESASIDNLYDVLGADPTEEMIFQASLLYTPETLQRLVYYSHLHSLGNSFFLNWAEDRYPSFRDAVLACGREYGIISK